MGQIKYDVFISYSSKDYFDGNKNVIPNNLISQIKSCLDAAGISYWFDEDGIYEGDEYAPKLTRAIKSSSILLFVSSANSNMSAWTRREIATAQRYGKVILPFKIDASEYDDSVEIWLAGINAINYYIAGDKAFERLIEVLQEHLKVRRAEQERQLREKEKQEEERRQKHENEQRELVTIIEQGVLRLDADESDVDMLRQRLQSHVQKIDDVETRERLTVLIEESGPIYVRQKDKITCMNKEMSVLTEKLRHQRRFQKMIGYACAFCFLLVGIVAIYYCTRYRSEKSLREVAETKIRLTELSNKLTTITFTVSDVKALESFLDEHQELGLDDGWKIAQDRIKVAEKILMLCSGDDYSAYELNGLSLAQESLIADVMPRLNEIEQRSESLAVLKNEIDEHDNRKKVFIQMCEPLSDLNCTISQLTEIIEYAETNAEFKSYEGYKQARHLRVCIHALMGENTRGNKYLKTSADVKNAINGHVDNLPAASKNFINKLMTAQVAYDSLPLERDFASLGDVKSYLRIAFGIDSL